jgi:flagellum-specific peptidoglycan hydrolase FlgJ
MVKFVTGWLIGIVCGFLLWSSYHVCVGKETREECDSLSIELVQPEFFLSDTVNVELLQQACDYYGIKHSDVVVSQAILETGHFKSDLCVEDNNLFGLYNSYTKKFYTFSHWTESVKAYKDLVQYRYKDGNYYEWLINIGYAEDTLYIPKVKDIKARYNL